MKRAKFCYNNYLVKDGFTFSSENASFPANNLVNLRRSRVWKASGSYEITSSNNVVYVASSSFTVPEGTYSWSGLVTAFGTASGGLSLTLGRNGNGLVTITKGASTTYNLSQRSNAIWDTLGFFQEVDVTGTVATAVERAYHTSEWIKVDVGLPQAAIYAALLPVVDEAFSAITNASIRLQGNNIDDWDTPPLDEAMTITGRGAFVNLDLDTGESYRYYRMKIVDPTNSAFTAAVAFIGDGYQTVNTNVATGFSRSNVDLSLRAYSESGSLFVDTRPKVLQLQNVGIQFLKEDDLNEMEQLFYDLGAAGPFLLVLDPDLSVSTSEDKMTHYVVLDGSPVFSHVFAGYYNCGFQLREVV